MWLKLKHVKTTLPIKKLDWIALPYRVLACMGTHVVQLDTPPGIHPVFHVSLVKKAAEDPLPSQLTIDNESDMIFDIPEDPSSVAINSDGEYTIDMVLELSYLGTALLLLIRDHKGGGEGGNCDGPRPYSIARPYTRLQLT